MTRREWDEAVAVVVRELFGARPSAAQFRAMKRLLDNIDGFVEMTSERRRRALAGLQRSQVKRWCGAGPRSLAEIGRLVIRCGASEARWLKPHDEEAMLLQQMLDAQTRLKELRTKREAT